MSLMEFQALQYKTIFCNYLYQLREKYHEAFMKNFYEELLVAK